MVLFLLRLTHTFIYDRRLVAPALTNLISIKSSILCKAAPGERYQVGGGELGMNLERGNCWGMQGAEGRETTDKA